MESNSEASCISDPNFAVICSFLERFASSCGISHPTFIDLQEMLENPNEVPQELIDLHIILLRKAKRSVFREKWERALIKFCHSYSTQDGWEIERFGYKNSRLEVKLRVLKTLLEGQFDLNVKFKTCINTLESMELRSKPLGRDKLGRIYWLQVDSTSNIRVYREDLDEESWNLVAQDRDSLLQLLQELSADELPIDDDLLNDNSNSGEIETAILDTGQENSININVNEKDNDNILVSGDNVSEEKDLLVDSDSPLDEKDPLVNGEVHVMEKDERVNGEVSEEKNCEGKYDEEKENLINGEATTEEKGDALAEEKDPLQIKSVENVISETKSEESQKDEPISGKRLIQDEFEDNREVKKLKSSEDLNEAADQVGEAIEEPVLHIFGEGNGVECDAGNPDKDDNDAGKEADSSTTEQSESSVNAHSSAELKKVDPDVKPAPKLWSIDTICGTGSVNHSGGTSKNNKVNQKNFSSFSIESVLEKKADAICTSNQPVVAESPIISVNTISVNNSQITNALNISKVNEQLESISNLDDSELKESESINENAVIPDAKDKNETFIYSSLSETEQTHKTEGEEINEPDEAKLLNSDSDPLTDRDNKANSEKVPDENICKETPGVNTLQSANAVVMENTTEVQDIKLVNFHSVDEMVNTSARSQESSKTKSENKLESLVRQHSDVKRADDEEEEDTLEKAGSAEEEYKNFVSRQSFQTTESSKEEEVEPEKVKVIINESDEICKESKIDDDRTAEKSEAILENTNLTKEVDVDAQNVEVEEKETVVEVANDQVTEISTEQKEIATSYKPEELEVQPSEDRIAEEPEECSVNKETEIVETEPIQELGIDEEAHEESTEMDHSNEEANQIETGSMAEDDRKEENSSKFADNESEDVVVKEESKEKDDVETEEVEDGLKNEDVKVETEDSVKEEVSVEKSESEETMDQDEVKEQVKTESAEVSRYRGEEPEDIIEEEAKADDDEGNGDDGSVENDGSTPVAKKRGRVGRRKKSEIPVQPQRVSIRTRKQSAEEGVSLEVIPLPPLRAARAKKKKNDEEGTEETPPGGEEENLEECEVSAAKKPQKRRNSHINSASDENSVLTQEESSEPVGGKRIKMRNKKSLDSKVRVSVEERRAQQDNSSEDEKPKEAETVSGNEQEKSIPRPKAASVKRQPIPAREMKNLDLSNMEEVPTVRQSRRIAQLKLKEEAERNRIKKLQEEEREAEEARIRKKKKKAGKLGKKKKKATSESYSEEDDPDASPSKHKDSKEEKIRKRRKKDKLKFNELNPWISSSESSSADEEEEEIEDEQHEEEEILFKSDHEFSPESDVEDPDYKPIKRARTAKVESKDDAGFDPKYDDTACEHCGKKDHPEWILLCDKCDKGWHGSCVRPALMVVPEGDWFCPPCEHTALVQRLRESLVEYDRTQKQRENEELRKKRLAFVGISLDNVLPSKKDKKPKIIDCEKESNGSASGRASEESDSSESSSEESGSSDESSEPVYQLRERRTNITSYRYNEYDELIKSALQDEMEAVNETVYTGNGKDINNQVEEEEKRFETIKVPNPGIEDNVAPLPNENPHPMSEIPADILNAKPKVRAKKKERDQDYEADTEDDEDYNEEEEEEEDEEEEEEEEEDELADEVPPVVPQYDKKKKRKGRSFNIKSLDFTSDEEEEDNSDSDFKGGSTEEESEFSMSSEPESSDGDRRRRKGSDGPLRRSTRARTSRYDRDFINDDSEDETPRHKKSRSMWASSESSDSDRSWGRRKKRGNRSGNRSTVPKRKSKSKGKKKKIQKRIVESENDDGEKPSPKKARGGRKIKYGGLDSLDEEQVLTRRTRGKKINYQELNASDSDDDNQKRRSRVIADSDEEFVAEKDKSEAEETDGEEIERKGEKYISRKTIFLRLKRRKTKESADQSEFVGDPEEDLEEFADDLDELDDEEEDILGEMLADSEVSRQQLRAALNDLKERRKEKKPAEEEIPKTYPPIPAHLENPATAQRFPKIGKMKITPSRSELAAQLGITPESVVAAVRANPGILLPPRSKEEEGVASIQKDLPQSSLLFKSLQGEPDAKETMVNMAAIQPNVQPPPYPFPAPDPTAGLPPVQVNNGPPILPYSSFQGMIPRLPPEYQHANIPTTVLGLENESQDKRKSARKSGAKSKRKNDDPMSPSSEIFDENSGDGRLPGSESNDPDSPPKRRGRGRGKKQLMAESQAKQELGIATVQAPTQFPGPVLPPEGGSVITRMLNTIQPSPQSFPEFPIQARPRAPFRPPFPNPIRTQCPPRIRGPLFPSHPVDPVPSAGGTIPLPQTSKPGFVRPPDMPRFPGDPNLRSPFPPRSPPPREGFQYPNFFGSFPPPPLSNSDEPAAPPFHNPSFPGHPFEEQPPGDAPAKPQGFEEETGGEFGGLASYFASQREDDLDT